MPVPAAPRLIPETQPFERIPETLYLRGETTTPFNLESFTLDLAGKELVVAQDTGLRWAVYDRTPDGGLAGSRYLDEAVGKNGIITFGRAENNTIVVKGSDAVSRQHFALRIDPEANTMLFKDHSANGTTIKRGFTYEQPIANSRPQAAPKESQGSEVTPGLRNRYARFLRSKASRKGDEILEGPYGYAHGSVLGQSTANLEAGYRSQNEDYFSIRSDNSGGLLVVLNDGLGGVAYGRPAARYANFSISERFFEKRDGVTTPLDALRHALVDASVELSELSKIAAIGETTAVAGYVENGALHIVSAGDSKAYLLRGGKLHLLTHIDTEAQALLERGTITQDQAKTHPGRNTLTQSLGARGIKEPADITTAKIFNLQRGDRIIFSSDGLDACTSSDITRLVSKKGDGAVNELIKRAKRNRATDNISVVVVTYNN